jgi:ABC-type nitrate/sulfonate/bicarbonate transport system permease component
MNEKTPATRAKLDPQSRAMKRRRRSAFAKREPLIYGTVAVVCLLICWEIFWQLGAISPLFFSGPSAVAIDFVNLAMNGNLAAEVIYTGKNFLVGFFIAVIIAVPLGVALGWYRRLNLFFDPIISALYAMPRIALYPLIIIWFGIGSGSKVFIVFLTAVFPILVNTAAGVRNIDPDLLKAARAFCATDRQIFMTVALPYSVPFILTGVRQGVALGLIGAIIGELFAGSEGIGYMISYAGQMFQTDTLLVGVVVVMAAGMMLTALIERVRRHFQKWRPEHTRNP